MTRFVLLLLAFLTTVSLAAQVPPRDAAASDAGTAVIRGRVTVAGTSDPVRRARVTVSPNNDLGTVLTDSNGWFEFRAVRAGRYEISAAKAGFATTRLGARRPLDRAASIEVAAGRVVDGVDLALARGAAITGRITDDLLDPRVGVSVFASRIVRTDGQVRLQPVAASQSDDLGDYRLGGLAQGSYVVSAAEVPTLEGSDLPSADRFVTIGGGPSGRVLSPRLFYPGVTMLTESQAIAVRAGDEMSGIDFTMTPTRTATVTMSVTGRSGASAGGSYTIVPVPAFMAIGRSGVVRGGTATATIEPGEWMAVVRGPDGMAISSLTTAGDDVEVRIVLAKGATLSGTVVFEGGRPPAASRVEVEAAMRGPGVLGLPPAVSSVAPDNTFSLRNLIGPRELRLRTAPRGWRIASLTIGGRSLLDEPVDFKGEEQLTRARLVLTSAHPRLEGRIESAAEQTLWPSAIVFPRDRSLWRMPARWVRWVKADSRGAFLVEDLPPGEYLAAAVEDVDETAWSNDDMLDRLRDGATPIALRDNETATVTLTAGATR